MDIFEQLLKIDEKIGEKQEKLEQERLFGLKKKSEMDFLVEESSWQPSEQLIENEKEKIKIAPLTAGFGPWSW